MQAIETKFTRSDYLENRCSHREYYAQFVTPTITLLVKARLSKQAIKAALAKDEHLNSIPLAVWDTITRNGHNCPAELMRSAGDCPSMAGGVCIAKEAVKQLVGA